MIFTIYQNFDKYVCKDKREYDALYSLVDYVRARVINVLLRMRAKGYKPYCVEGKRSLARQLKLMVKGTSNLKHSKHLVGKAADIVDADLFWKASEDFKVDLVISAVGEGLVSGNSWKRFGRWGDWAHCQWGK